MTTANPNLRTVLIGICMLAAAGLAYAMKPTRMVAGADTFQLESAIPRQFGAWTEQKQQVQIVDPRQQETIDRIYSQVLMRSYVNGEGVRVMLSIAYGDNQEDDLQVHRPEVCYPAQGAQLLSTVNASLPTPWGEIPIRRLTTQFGPRHEPVTYWVMVGDRAIIGSLQGKLAQMRYGFRGQIPDGMLVRASTIDPDDERAFAQQARFLQDLLAAVPPETRKRLSGLQ
ncbi:MAG: EpsI family protein [Immundisolibacter sp.]|uniref:exosortase-associated protein EpsI, B-type n=1 Tax=Immundisolibacter sp. TaxID=1934948 RepID=UPI001994D61D|nr:exosortase-associated protein EpsI, B-type [Immundisolibacter sp.]MBC7162750.1 EpsI family protein [Immundisolibacter sp.]